MAVTLEYTLARAQECTLAAESSGLDNVRDRYLRSAKAWQAMADRMVQTESMRTRTAQDKLLDD